MEATIPTRDLDRTRRFYELPGLKTVNGIAELGGIGGAWFKDPEGNIVSVMQLPAT